jgi:hypothetical protein
VQDTIGDVNRWNRDPVRGPAPEMMRRFVGHSYECFESRPRETARKVTMFAKVLRHWNECDRWTSSEDIQMSVFRDQTLEISQVFLSVGEFHIQSEQPIQVYIAF